MSLGVHILSQNVSDQHIYICTQKCQFLNSISVLGLIELNYVYGTSVHRNHTVIKLRVGNLEYLRGPQFDVDLASA
jgi:hypothetical protein